MKEAILITDKDFQKIRKKIKENLGKKIIFSSDDDDLNRKVMEKEKVDVLLINQKNRKDFQKQRNSGFNHILAKIAKKKNASVGIKFDEILDSNKFVKAEILSRIMQNIKLCSKNKVKMCFVFLNSENRRNLHDLKSLGLVLAMPTWMTRDLQVCEL